MTKVLVLPDLDTAPNPTLACLPEIKVDMMPVFVLPSENLVKSYDAQSNPDASYASGVSSALLIIDRLLFE
tara:strand:- start:1774 stop:1986 length:213 start_codon:yes stop_codon:yes gene_type:complete